MPTLDPVKLLLQKQRFYKEHRDEIKRKCLDRYHARKAEAAKNPDCPPPKKPASQLSPQELEARRQNNRISRKRKEFSEIIATREADAKHKKSLREFLSGKTTVPVFQAPSQAAAMYSGKLQVFRG